MVHLFVHLLMEANHDTQKWQGITVKRGQLIAGRRSLAAATGLSERSVRTCLKRLKSTSELTIKTTNRFSIITICNYDSYQNFKSENVPTNDQPPVQQATSKRPANDHKQQCKQLNNTNKKTTYDEKERKFTNLTDDDILQWQDTFPLVNVHQELKSMVQWLVDNPERRKQQYRRFIGNWLRKAHKDQFDKAAVKISGSPICKRCGQPAYIWVYDDTGTPYWVCKVHTPPSKMPAEILKKALKRVPQMRMGVSDGELNDRRNRNKNALKVR